MHDVRPRSSRDHKDRQRGYHDLIRHNLSIGILNEQDIPQLIGLSEKVGWDYDEPEIKTIMESGTVYGHRTKNGEITACAAIVPYKEDLASLGMVIVHPDYRRLGLGKAVTIKCVQSLPDSVPIMLISTTEGKPMYEQLGFKTVDSVQKFLCDSFQRPMNLDMSEYTIEPFQSSYLPQIVELDQAACGARRDKFLAVRIEQAKDAIVVKNSSGNVVGYALSIGETVNALIGPIVAPNHEVAINLLDSLVIGSENRIRIDIPQGQTEFGSILLRCGFKMVSQPPIMVLNRDELPKRSGHLFGIAAQVFG